MKTKRILPVILLLYAATMQAQTSYRTDRDIPYVADSETDSYRRERCKLDIYFPEDSKDYPTVIWFHGGGLEGGNKYIPKGLTEQGFAVIAPNYRLSPKATNPSYIEDAAAAVAWTFDNIEKYGGRKDRIFVSGHSAGGYLSLILATDKRYLDACGADADSVAAYLPVSGQTVTHYTIRKERGLPAGIPIIDEYAPVNRARKNTSPIVMITGDRNLEMADRYEENALMASVMKNIGNPHVRLYEMQGCDHGQIVGPACCLIADYVKRFAK